MQYSDFVAFRDGDKPVATLNIGGLANVQLVCGKDRSKLMAFDTGPGNVMINHAIKARTSRALDKNGELAAKETIIQPLLGRLLSHPFFERKPLRSAWRTGFGFSFADKMLQDYTDRSMEDLLAALTPFTAISVERAIVDYVLPQVRLTRLIASGGGVRNACLLQLI